MNTTQIAKRSDGTVLKRGDIVRLRRQTVVNLTFAYVTDDGCIATQERGQLPVIRPVDRLLGITVVNKEETK